MKDCEIYQRPYPFIQDVNNGDVLDDYSTILQFPKNSSEVGEFVGLTENGVSSATVGAAFLGFVINQDIKNAFVKIKGRLEAPYSGSAPALGINKFVVGETAKTVKVATNESIFRNVIVLKVTPGNTYVNSLTMNAAGAGTGYAVGDELTVSQSGSLRSTITVATVKAVFTNSLTMNAAGAGTGYAVGDELTVSQSGSLRSTITVSTVDTDGEILTFTATPVGNTSSSISETAIAAVGGTGTGATFDITSTGAVDNGEILTFTATPVGNTSSSISETAIAAVGGTGTGATFDITSVQSSGLTSFILI